MFKQPLFWAYLLILLRIFLHLTNAVSFHPHPKSRAATWTLFWTGVFLSALISLSYFLVQAWDFTFQGWKSLGLPWQFLMVVLGASGAWLWLDHPLWVLFRKKKPLFRLLSCERVQIPEKFKAPFGFLGFFGMENQIFQPEIVRYEVHLPGWPEEFSGLSLVQISDLHYGPYIPLEYMQIVLAAVSNLKPDLFVFTGDYVSLRDGIQDLPGLFKGFKARLGVYGLLGNHDYWADAGRIRKILEDDGVKVLVNEVVSFERKGKTLALMGVDDYWVGQKNDLPLLEAKGEARILLAHQPAHFKLAKRLGAHLQVSGHCHGGQICFPLLGPLIVPSGEGRKYAGGFVREGNTTLFIHRGIAGYPPIRTLCPPEIVELIIKSA
jgi:uncharacterized protein